MSRRVIQRFRAVDGNPNRNRTHRNYLLLNRDPVILITPESTCDLQLFAELLEKGEPAVFIKLLWWSHESIYAVRSLASQYAAFTARFPSIRLLIVCNTEKEYFLLSRAGLPCIHANQNALLDPDSYSIEEVGEPRFDVVYNGRILPYKRHYLLEGIASERIALISARLLDSNQEGYVSEICDLLPDASLLNRDPVCRLRNAGDLQQMPQLTSAEISRAIGNAHVGVVLSAEEGACYASAEYLLCGRPVVSTTNIGGRDVFLTDDVAIKVKPDSKAVSRAVETLINRSSDRASIRNTTLERMAPHRESFFDGIQDAVSEIGSSIDVRSDCRARMIDKMVEYGLPFPTSFERELRNVT